MMIRRTFGDRQRPLKNPYGCAPYPSVTEKLGNLQDLGITRIVLYMARIFPISEEK
jgi:hypothetical protein